MTTDMISADAAGTWGLGDLTVNRIGFGAMRLTQDGPALRTNAPAGDRDRAIGVLRLAVELGVNHIDTASFYFSSLRSANELINRALGPYADDLVIATKVGPGRDPSGAFHWATPGQLRGQVEENLRQLGRDHLDVVNLRLPGSAAEDSLAEHFGALADLRTAGLVRHLGISNVRAHHLVEARSIAPVVCVQNPYGIDSPAEDHALVELCGKEGIAFVPFFAIAGTGKEAGSVADDGGRLRAAAEARGVSVAQLRLAWTLHRGPHVLAIPGTGNPDHLVENVSAGALRLTAEEISALEARPS